MKVFAKILWALAAVLEIAAGIYCLCSPAATLEALAIAVGVMLLLSGALMLVIYFNTHLLFGSGWLLIDAVATFILGIFVMSNTILVAGVFPILFSIWILLSGVSKTVHSCDLKKFGEKYWWITLTEGILLLILGILSMLDFASSAIAVSILTGIFLIVMGIENIVDLVYTVKCQKFLSNAKKKIDDVYYEIRDAK